MPDLPDLIPLADAQRRVFDGIEPLPVETVDLAHAAGRVLAGPVRSELTVPSWSEQRHGRLRGPERRHRCGGHPTPRSSSACSARCRPAGPRTGWSCPGLRSGS